MNPKRDHEKPANTLPLTNDQLIADYRLAYRSRQAAIIGRREVLTGKAKFGIFGDGKELPQLAMAHFFRKGDWRSGYYRDQTWMMAMGHLTLENFFAQLYAHSDPAFERMTGGRNMNGHFATPLIDKNGEWLPQVEMKNSSADMAPTAAHMPRTVGLAYASVLYRQNPLLKQFTDFSHNGDEVVWSTIGNASTAQGKFWEAVNAIGVLKAPAIISVYDDGYGISVPNQFQMVKENIFTILKGFQRDPCPADQCDRGYDLYQVEGWDYQKLLDVYEAAAFNARKHHIPALVHVTELTQPQGHSTSGSHERYKTAERLEWELQHDGLRRYREWLIRSEETSEEELAAWEVEDLAAAEAAAKTAFENFQDPLRKMRSQAAGLLTDLSKVSSHQQELEQLRFDLNALTAPLRRDTAAALHEALQLTRAEPSPEREALAGFARQIDMDIRNYYDTFLISDSPRSPLKVKPVPPIYSAHLPMLMGFGGHQRLFRRRPGS